MLSFVAFHAFEALDGASGRDFGLASKSEKIGLNEA
jgi:hypothetical protein